MSSPLSLWLDDCCLLSRVQVAERFGERLRGLLGRTGLPPGEGLRIPQCGSIHTVGMRFAIDVLFLDRQDRVVRLCPAVPPWRLVCGGRGATQVVESCAGALNPRTLSRGATLRWRAPQGDG